MEIGIEYIAVAFFLGVAVGVYIMYRMQENKRKKELWNGISDIHR